MPDGEARLVLAFDTDDVEFTRGVEIGIIWAYCRNIGGFHGPSLLRNAEMVMRIAESLNLPFFAESTDHDEWLVVHIGPEPDDCEFRKH